MKDVGEVIVVDGDVEPFLDEDLGFWVIVLVLGLGDGEP